MRNHDYLQLPEIMEDICAGYEREYGQRIYEQLENALVPKIVKFWSDERKDKTCVESAMYYLYSIPHGLPLTMCSNTCFDGKNTPILSEQITNVEVVHTLASA
jgi:hypothetical protein